MADGWSRAEVPITSSHPRPRLACTFISGSCIIRRVLTVRCQQTPLSDRRHPADVWPGATYCGRSRRATGLPALRRVEQSNPGEVIWNSDDSPWVASIQFDTLTGLQTFTAKHLSTPPLERFLPLPETRYPPGARGSHLRAQHAVLAANGRQALVATERVEMQPFTEINGFQEHYKGKCRLEWWDFEEGRRLAIWNESAEEDGLAHMTLAGDGRFVVTEGAKTVKVWNVATGQVEHQWPTEEPFTGVLFTPDRRHLARFSTGTWHGRGPSEHSIGLEIYDLVIGRLVRNMELKDYHSQNRTRPIALHPGGSWLATYDDQHHLLELWNLTTGKLWAAWTPHEGAQCMASFSPDGKLLITGGGGSLRLWPLDWLRDEVTLLERKEVR